MKKWRATVDRLEEGCAVLIPEDRPSMRIIIDRTLLPSGIHDGSLLVFKVERDKADALCRREVAALQAELEGASPPAADGSADGCDGSRK